MNITTKLTHYAAGYELDNLINRTYSTDSFKLDFSLAVDQFMADDTSYATTVSPVSFSELDKWDKETIDKFLSRGHGEYVVDIFLNDLCAQGIIPAGDYIFSHDV